MLVFCMFCFTVEHFTANFVFDIALVDGNCPKAVSMLGPVLEKARF
jgi:hypothetical protein